MIDATSKYSNISVIKRILWYVLGLCTVIELSIFPSINNLIGVIVSILSTMLFFKHIFRIDIIRRFPICFIVLLNLFCFMYLPLIATLIDGKSMSHDLYNPVSTYILQFLYFCVSLLAFKVACQLSYTHKGLQRILQKFDYFTSPTSLQLWLLGIIGWIPKLYLLFHQYSDEQEGIGTLSMFSIFVYAPILILYKPLMGGCWCTKKERIGVWVYIICLAILMIATNSRSQMISPFIIVGMCYLISMFYERTKKIRIKASRVIICVVAMFVVTGPAEDMAYAMLAARSIRSDVSFTQLLDYSWNIYNDKKALSLLKKTVENAQTINQDYRNWNEDYVSNLFLNRFCNYRVVDATIYHALRIGIPNAKMQEDFLNHLVVMFPQPMVDFMFGHKDKSKYAYSMMDKLYAESMRSGDIHISYIVGGDVGLGISVFGWLYFLLQFIVYALLFLLCCNLVCWRGNTPIFSLMVLLNIYFTYFLMFKVGGGFVSHITFLIWGFPVATFFQLLVYRIVIIITSLFKRR